MEYMNEVFDFALNNEIAKRFFKKFGGEITYGSEYGFLYVYRKKAYSLKLSFREDMFKSLEQNKNLLKQYQFIFKESSFVKKMIIYIKYKINLRKIDDDDLCKYVFSQDELLGLITVALKQRYPFLGKCQLLRFFNLQGKLSITGNFVYSILFIKRFITIYDIWNEITSETEGKTKKEFLSNLDKLLKKYHYPRYCLSYFRSFVNPETNKVEDYPVLKEEKARWKAIDN
ncbi:MAG: hypothetical protein IK024_10900 [Treponema sp.]|nr:hypothetical protein [Treponema sp.]